MAPERMVTLLIEMLSFTFMQNALAAAIIVGLLCSFVSFFVVLKKLGFLGVGISHSALGGIAIGLVTGLNPVLTGSIFAMAVAVIIGHISRNTRISEDTVIGIFFSSGMALGIGIISVSKGYYPELFSLLFGNILAVSKQDLIILGTAMVLVVAYLAIFLKELLAICFDEEMAVATGLPVGALLFGLMAAMGLTIMVSVQVVGIVMASALLVIPAATGYRLSDNYRYMLAISLAVGLTGCVGGLIISYYLNVPSGASIVLTMTALFFLSLLFRKN